MTISVGGHAKGNSTPFGSSTTVTTGTTGTSASGSKFLIFVNAKSQSISSVSDSFGNSYTLKATSTGFNKIYVYLCESGSGGANHTATVNMAAADSLSIFIVEVVSAATTSFDVVASGSDTSGSNSTLNGASVTTTNATDLILSCIGAFGDTTTVTDSGSGFSLVDSVTTSGTVTSALSSSRKTSTGSYNDSYTFGSTNYFAFATIALKEGAAPAALGNSLIRTPGPGPGYPFNPFLMLGRTGSTKVAPSNALLGTSVLTFAQTGTLTGTGAIAGSSGLTFGETGALKGAGAITGSSALVFAQTGALTGSGVLTGSSALVFGQTGTLTQPGLVGSAGLIFGQTGTLTAAGVLAGSSALQFGQTAALTGSGSLAGTSALTFAQTANLIAAGILAGASALSFAQAATLSASGALVGSSALTFGASATADLPAGSLVGAAALAFGGTGALAGFAELIGNCEILFDASGVVPASGQPGALDSPLMSEGAFRRKRKKRRQIEDIVLPAEPVRPTFPTVQVEGPTEANPTVHVREYRSLAQIASLPPSLEVDEIEMDDQEAMQVILHALGLT